MARRLCLHTLTRQAIALPSSNPTTLHHPFTVVSPFTNLNSVRALLISRSFHIFINADSTWCIIWSHHRSRYLSSDSRDTSENDEEDEETEEEESDGEGDMSSNLKREYSAEEREAEAAAIALVVSPSTFSFYSSIDFTFSKESFGKGLIIAR
ncbi:uncharacterized protein LOC110615936 [Manihot esculenta]|uniref:uncharacterized protein LOC110615936 n=1 Tax=Manihot esculenta TaxID=3983 RepID=UPI000B5D6089|nr:uncharacterized protein LOC110615936 [Manihot esculenta]